MALVIYNTASREKEVFTPYDRSRVRMYVCGPTVYDYAHIGNARPAVVFDLLYRLLRQVYGATHVKYVRNITDVDDKINAAAQEKGISIREITERTARQYQEDMRALNALDPDEQPRATEHIGPMIAMIENLIARGHAYAVDGHVLFAVSSFDKYGALSGRNRDEMIAGARIEVAPYKQDPADFVLWKPSTPDLPGWDSPWGRGRPGWHIECSAMSKTHLGESFDIHGGGIDLTFPHHENEIAQSVCANDAPFARYWMHNGFVMVNGEKMSKSLGNFFTVHDLLKDWPGEVIRLTLLQTHYRQPLDINSDSLQQAKAQLDRWYRIADPAALGEPTEDFLEALCDDLNTPRAISLLNEWAHAANHDPNAAKTLAANARFMGFLHNTSQEWFRGGVADDVIQNIEDLIAERQAAKAAKDFAKADAIRAQLADRGIQLEDKPGGKTEWRRV